MTQVTISIKIYAPIEVVWDTWTGPQHITQRNHASQDWYCPASENDLRVGGLFCHTMSAKDGSFSFDFVGQYKVVDECSRIEYVMGEMAEGNFLPGERTCVVEFQEDGSCGCVTLTETFDAETENDIEMQRAGWMSILENFRKYVEGV